MKKKTKNKGKIRNLTVFCLLVVFSLIIYFISCYEEEPLGQAIEKNYLIVDNSVTIPPVLLGHGNRLSLVVKNPYKTIRTKNFANIPEELCEKKLPLRIVSDGKSLQLTLGKGDKSVKLDCSLLNIEELMMASSGAEFISIDNFQEFARVVYLGDTTPNFTIGFEVVPLSVKNLRIEKDMKPPMAEEENVARKHPISVFCEKILTFPKLKAQGDYHLLLTARDDKKQLVLKKIAIDNKNFFRNLTFSVALLHYFDERKLQLDCELGSYEIELQDLALKFKNMSAPVSKNKFYEIAEIHKYLKYPDREENVTIKIGCELVLAKGVEITNNRSKKEESSMDTAPAQ